MAWGNVVDGFYDPVIDLAVARFKAVSLANGTGPISHSDEYVEPSPHPEDVDPFFIDQIHDKGDRRLPVIVGETSCLIITPTPNGVAPYGRGTFPGYMCVTIESMPK